MLFMCFMSSWIERVWIQTLFLHKIALYFLPPNPKIAVILNVTLVYRNIKRKNLKEWKEYKDFCNRYSTGTLGTTGCPSAER